MIDQFVLGPDGALAFRLTKEFHAHVRGTWLEATVIKLLEYELETGDIRRGLIGYDAELISGTATPRLSAARRYDLDPAPAVTGTWNAV